MKFLTKLALLTTAGVGITVLRRRLNPPLPYDFRGKSVLITGGSRGLGLVLAREFAAEGALLTLVARDGTELEQARQELAARGADVLAFTCDVRDEREAAMAVERAVARYGGIDVLVNNAGVIQAGPVEHMQTRDFEDALATHMWGPLYTMRAAAPHMRRQRQGRIINIASIGGKVAVPHLAPYTTSKFALAGLSDAMRAELAKDGIHITTVFPGLMRTGSHFNALFKGQHKKEFTWFSLLDALPFSSIDAQSAAHQIIEASRKGAPQLVISFQAKALAWMSALLPGLTARSLKLMNWFLPAPANNGAGDQNRSGWDSQSALAPSVLTQLADEATVENNGLHGRTAEAPL